MPVFQLNTSQVVLDVVVTDRDGKPVHGLQASDFTLRENGQKQAIAHFQEHTVAEDTQASVMPKLAPGVFTNYVPMPANGSMNVILFDALNTPLMNWEFARSELEKYLKDAPPNGRIAIFALTSRLRLVQGFTSNPNRLRAAMNSHSLNDLWKDSEMGLTPIFHASSGMFAGYGPRGIMEQNRILMTLDALNQLGRYLSGLPGRKNLLWISASFPMGIMDIPGIGLPMAIDYDAQPELRETADLLAGSQVSVYPIDARGLMVGPMANAARQRPGGEQAFLTRLGYEHDTMRELAQQTGGHAFVNTNGIRQTVARSIDDGSNYYAISYAPSDQRWNGRYRNIRISVDRKGLSLAYRRGYYADSPYHPTQPGEMQSETQDAPEGTMTPERQMNGNSQLQPKTPPPPPQPRFTPMDYAMEWGSPGPTQILFAVTVKPLPGREKDVVPENRKLGKTRGPFQRFTVDFDLAQRSIDCPAAADGSHTCKLLSRIFVYDTTGRVVNLANDFDTMTVPASRAATLQNGIAHFQRVISVPVKGDYFLRIGVQDLGDGHIGAVEVPMADIHKHPVG